MGIFPLLIHRLQERYFVAIRAAMAEFEINTSKRIAAFLAQIGHETEGLRFMEELGGAAYFARYDGREDLGNTQPGDGARYHGRGLIQLTGRSNYREFGAALGLPLEQNPGIAAQVENGARIAGLYWRRRGCNAQADLDRFEAITRRINGGLNGLASRLGWWRRTRVVLGLPEFVA